MQALNGFLQGNVYIELLSYEIWTYFQSMSFSVDFWF